MDFARAPAGRDSKTARPGTTLAASHAPPRPRLRVAFDADERGDLAPNNALGFGPVSYLQPRGHDRQCGRLGADGRCLAQRTGPLVVQHDPRPAGRMLCLDVQWVALDGRATGAVGRTGAFRTLLGARATRVVAARLLCGAGPAAGVSALPSARPLAVGAFGRVDGRRSYHPLGERRSPWSKVHVSKRRPWGVDRSGTARRPHAALRRRTLVSADDLLPHDFGLSLVARSDAH